MKKMKSGLPPMLFEDSETKFKHHTLIQDYQKLHRETEITRKNLDLMKQNKSILAAEVRFLRGRYEYLMQKQSSKIQPYRTSVLPRNSEIKARTTVKEKIQCKKEGNMLPPVPRFDSNRKGKVNEKAGLQQTSPNLDLKLTKKSSNRNQVIPIPDLNVTDRPYGTKVDAGMKGAERKGLAPVFDLNQISMEEEELQVHDEQNNSLTDESEELYNDVRLSSICRNTENGSNRAGKRKISWQDPVALKV